MLIRIDGDRKNPLTPEPKDLDLQEEEVGLDKDVIALDEDFDQILPRDLRDLVIPLPDEAVHFWWGVVGQGRCVCRVLLCVRCCVSG